MQLSTLSIIEKYRYEYYYEGKKWEVDEFMGMNSGLIVAEIELESEEEKFAKPDWIGKELTESVRYRNSELAKTPFKAW
jgi:adenylate cyclase